MTKKELELEIYKIEQKTSELKRKLKSLERCKIIKRQPHKFEVYHEDANLKLNHLDALEYCSLLGNGWRLPTRKELLEMYDHKEALGLKNTPYWSSTEYNTTYAFNIYFFNGHASATNKFSTYSVRAVRTIK